MGFKKRSQVLLIASLLILLSASLAIQSRNKHNNGDHCLKVMLMELGSVLCFLATVICLDIWRLNPADSHTLRTLYSQYRIILILRLKAPYLRWLIRKKTMDAKKTSEETLLNIIGMNKDTAYGRDNNLGQIKSREDFVRQHPITTHDRFKPYVDRILNNAEKNVLHSDETKALIGTSGTTGASKVYPFSETHIQDCRFWLGQICPLSFLHMMNLQRYAQFHIYTSVKPSPGGIPMSAGTQVLFHFPLHNLIPIEYSRLHLEDQSYYAQALFSLAEREMRYISGFSADLMYAYWKFIIKNWENLCTDIANGEIGDHIKMPLDVKQDLSKHLRPDPSRAAELRNAIKLGSIGIAKKIWPDMKFILMGKGAAFKLCAGALMRDHLKGLQVIDFGHGATEGMLGFNMRTCEDDDNDDFTVCLFNASFTEFIPVENVEEDQPQTVFPENVKVGHQYELVITNAYGLYRNRFGDIVKITGFTNGTPKYKFEYKLGQRLNIAYERTPDQFLIQAIERETKNLQSGAKLVDFTSVESIITDKIKGDTSKGHYVFFVEFNTDEIQDNKSISKRMDIALAEIYAQYKRFKDTESIGPIEVVQVKCGTFDGIKSHIWGNNPHAQFKMPRVLRREPALKYMLDQAVH